MSFIAASCLFGLEVEIEDHVERMEIALPALRAAAAPTGPEDDAGPRRQLERRRRAEGAR